MPTDSALFSEDDWPLAADPLPNGKNHVNKPHTNGHVNEPEDYEMSDDDQPLVSRVFLCHVRFVII
jgi:DNA topoisomerase-1